MNLNEKYNNGNPVLSKRMKELRTGRGLSQEQLADLIEKQGGRCSSANYISMLESSKRAISKQMANYLSQIFEVDPSYLLDESVEYKTATEKFNNEFQQLINKGNQEAFYLYNTICFLGELSNYKVEIKSRADITKEINNTLALGKGRIADSFREYIVFYHEGEKCFSLSLEEANKLGNLINDVFLSYIKHFIMP